MNIKYTDLIIKWWCNDKSDKDNINVMMIYWDII